MDNKITKSRLSDLLSYEWILMIVIAVVSIFAWEIFYTVGSVKLTVGQDFKYYYDQNIIVEDDAELRSRLVNGNTFSYDVLKLSAEALSKENFVLGDRLSIQEGDVIFTDSLGLNEFEDENQTIPKTVRAKSLIDSDKIYIGSLDQMVYDAKIYLTKNFFVDGAYSQIEQKVVADEILPNLITLLSEGNTESEKILNSIDDDKVEKMFLKRNKEDNRFREKSAVKKGIELEKERIIKLCENVLFFEDFIQNNQEALLSYTRYSQSAEKGFVDYHADWTQKQKQKNLRRFGKEDEIFGIKIGRLKNGGEVSKVMRVANPKDQTKVAEDVVLLTFDFKKYQPDLQYESLSFVCTTIRTFSGE